MKTLRIATAAVLVMSAVSVLAAQETQPADPRAEIERANKERTEQSKKLNEFRRKMQELPEVIALRQAADDVSKAYNEKVSASPAVVAARKAQADAYKALADLIDAKVAADQEGAAALKAQQQANEKKIDQQYDAAHLELELNSPLSPIQRKLNANPEWIAAQKAAGKDKQARAALEKKRQELLQAMPEAKEVIADLDAARKDIRDAEAAVSEAGRKLKAIRAKIESGKDNDILVARDRIEDAGQAVAKAQESSELQALRAKADEANKAAADKLKQLLEASPEAAAASQKMRELSARLDELRKPGENKQKPAKDENAPAPTE